MVDFKSEHPLRYYTVCFFCIMKFPVPHKTSRQNKYILLLNVIFKTLIMDKLQFQIHLCYIYNIIELCTKILIPSRGRNLSKTPILIYSFFRKFEVIL